MQTPPAAAAEEKERGRGRGGWREAEGGRNGKTGITALHCPAANPSSTSHKNIWHLPVSRHQHFQLLPHTQGCTRKKKTKQNVQTHKHAHTFWKRGAFAQIADWKVFPRSVLLCFSDSMKSAFHQRREGVRVGGVGGLPLRFHPFSMAPPSSGGPHTALCADRWPVASLEVGLLRVHRAGLEKVSSLTFFPLQLRFYV